MDIETSRRQLRAFSVKGDHAQRSYPALPDCDAVSLGADAKELGYEFSNPESVHVDTDTIRYEARV